MKRAAAAALIGAFLAGTPAAACSVPGNAPEVLAEVGTQMNGQRRAKGLGQLSRNDKLDEAAQAHACWIAKTGAFGHKGQNGSTPKARVQRTGYQSMLTAENIAWGQGGAAPLIKDWMASKGHRDNILRRGVDEYGVGVSMMNGRPVWVMVLADPR